MAKTWLQLRVDLLGASGEELEPAPGRVFIVGPGQSFERLAVAINQAFARWDHSHLHEFELADARKIGYPDDEGDIGPGWEDHAALKVTEELTPGDEFSFTYDLGDEWRTPLPRAGRQGRSTRGVRAGAASQAAGGHLGVGRDPGPVRSDVCRGAGTRRLTGLAGKELAGPPTSLRPPRRQLPAFPRKRRRPTACRGGRPVG